MLHGRYEIKLATLARAKKYLLVCHVSQLRTHDTLYPPTPSLLPENIAALEGDFIS